jgi:hypothetical protein
MIWRPGWDMILEVRSKQARLDKYQHRHIGEVERPFKGLRATS